MVRPRMYVEAPPVTPLPFGLLSAALVLDDLTGHAQMGVQYEPEACGVAHATRAACEDAADGETLDEDAGIPVVTADPFVVYTLFRCAPVGVDLEDRARRALRMGEQRGVEEAVAGLLPITDGAVDLTPTPGSATHPMEGLAILEGWSAANYGGVGVIHSPRKATTLLPVERNAGRLETRQGTLIASGGGYHDLAGPPTDAADPATVQAPAAGTAWLYVTGQVVVRRDPQVQATPLVMERTPAAKNVGRVLAERTYAASWECITGAVLVSTAFHNGFLGGTSYPGVGV